MESAPLVPVASKHGSDSSGRTDDDPRSWTEVVDVAEVIILIAPMAIFWILLQMIDWCSVLFVGCEIWDNPGSLASKGTTCDIKDIMEQPSWSFHAGILLLSISIVLYYRQNLEMLKRSALFLSSAITTIIRCLSSFSGRVSSSRFSWVIFNSNSPAKVVWLSLLLEMEFWYYTYLGMYADVRYDKDSFSVIDEHGTKVQQLQPGSLDTNISSMCRRDTSTIYRPWEEILARMSYIHVVDNLIHIIWLRYFISNAPYTAYRNNSEILTLQLVVSVVIYTYARMRTHVVFDHDDEETSIDSSSEHDKYRVRKSMLEGLLRSPVEPRFQGYYLDQQLLLAIVSLIVCSLVVIILHDPSILMFLVATR
ncbi:hypothetical protein K491DRAFT_720853 [Lophiostoma macrostomum CBS 122681]|uniref:Uncharacterized protein n=1 Tax=Lophiostoma macrostomum CBS 122681 TaxID=1314788 RepID=A0A6A6SR33_9PLEO|nr:hypothetical protein K491DRAFT_720853 [Lophiostoma macrostomum CBS 122681]